MFRRQPTLVPDGVPVLSRGRHRNARKGACFMEMASFLAGEQWSDHPACTHPLLATVARCVNDLSDDQARQRLTPMINDVIGLHPSDPRVEPLIVATAARAALPVAAQERQNLMAVAILSAEVSLNRLNPGVAHGEPISAASAEALARVPAAEAWARRFMASAGTTGQPLKERSAPKIAALAVESIATACVPDTDERLVSLLRECIDVTRSFTSARPLFPETTPASGSESAAYGSLGGGDVGRSATSVADAQRRVSIARDAVHVRH